MSKEDLKPQAEALRKAVGKRARDARESAGFSSADSAAKAMGVSATALYELERGHSWISAEMACLVSRYYGVSIASLMADHSVPTPKQAVDVLRNFVEGHK